jgi:hypothetical protein
MECWKRPPERREDVIGSDAADCAGVEASEPRIERVRGDNVLYERATDATEHEAPAAEGERESGLAMHRRSVRARV